MRRFLSCCIIFSLVLSLTGCAAKDLSAEATADTLPSGSTGVPSETSENAGMAAKPEGFLYLTVSRITFSLVGESEDIYIGTLPRDAVTWVSGDESVAAFTDGVLQATGVGETTVYAEYDGERIECSVACLAETEEALMQLDSATLRSPKRLPPAVSEDALTFYDDAAIIGDSITYILFQWQTLKGYLGNPQFLCRGGCSINGFVLGFYPLFYHGKNMTLEDALFESGVKKAFIMLGQNDVSYLTLDETMDNWALLLDRIRGKNPDLTIYFQSLIPEWFQDAAPNTKNEKIEEYNLRLEQFAKDNDCYFIDVAYYAKDHLNKLPTEYSLDQGIHMNESGCMAWMQLLKAYAEYQYLKGEIK